MRFHCPNGLVLLRMVVRLGRKIDVAHFSSSIKLRVLITTAKRRLTLITKQTYFLENRA